MPRDYTLHFAAIAAAQEREREARVAMALQAREIRAAAIEEALSALAEAGISLGKTILTLRGRWAYQDKPVIVRSLTCWSAPTEINQKWSFQAHYFQVKSDGERDGRFNDDYACIIAPHPSETGSKLLERMPRWQNDQTLTARARVVQTETAA